MAKSGVKTKVRKEAEEKRRVREEASLRNNLKTTVTQGKERHTTVICYNSACSDYRKERTDGSDCSCKRGRVQGAGI